jgi:ketosteroid isomerase-like protein
MSQENVDLIRSFQPRPEINLVEFFADDVANTRIAGALAHVFDPAFVCFIHFPGDAEPTPYSGVDGLRQGWRDWLSPWATYRTEVEEVIDLGEQVVIVFRDHARREPDAPEVHMRGATIWTVREGRVARADFYAGGRAEALASVGLAE